MKPIQYPGDGKPTPRSGRVGWPWLIGSVACFGSAGFFAWLFYIRFWKYRHEILEVDTSYTTPDGATLIAGGGCWSVFVVLFGLLGLALLGFGMRMGSREGHDGAE